MEKWPYLRRENLPQYPWPVVGQPAYENYYGQVYHRQRRICLWWRYTFVRTDSGTVVPRLWAAFFDAADASKNRFMSTVIDPDQVQVNERGLVFGERGLYRLGGCEGHIDDGIAWKLSFTENTVAFSSVDIPLLGSLLSKSRNISPNNDIRVSGSLTIGQEQISLRDEPGHQGHTWGSVMAPGWVWCHCNSFAETDTVCELVALDKGNRAAIGSIYLYWRGRRLYLNRFSHIMGRRWLVLPGERNTFAWDGQSLTFTGTGDGVRIEGEVVADRAQYHLVRYLNTDDTFLYNLNDSVAKMTLRVSERKNGQWGTPDIFHSEGAQVEFVSTAEPADELTEKARRKNRSWQP